MKIKSVTVGAFAALSLGLAALPAQAYILGYNNGYGAQLNLSFSGGGGDSVVTNGSGWYSSGGTHYAANDYYGAATYDDPAFIALQGEHHAFHDFLVFDISALTPDIVVTAADIMVRQNSSFSIPGSSAPIGSPEYWRLGGYYGDPSAFLVDTVNSNAGVTIFNTLGSGPAYGYHGFTVADDNTDIVFALDANPTAAFLVDFNAAIQSGRGYFVMGGRIGAPNETSPEPLAPAVVPEPASWAMMILGFLGVGAALRARRRTAIA